MAHLRVVGGATHVGMQDLVRAGVLLLFKRLTVEARYQNGLDATVRAGTDGQRPRAGCFHPFGWITPGQTHQSEACPVTLFWIAARLEDVADGRSGRGADFTGPVDQPFRRPFEVVAAGWGAGGGRGGGDTDGPTRRARGHAAGLLGEEGNGRPEPSG